MWSAPRSYKDDNWGNTVSWALQGRLTWDGDNVELIIVRFQLRDIRCTGRTWAREAEESPLLEAVVRERLLKTLKSGEGLVFAAVVCKVWRLVMALSLLVIPSRVVKWSINPISNLYPVYSHIPKSWYYYTPVNTGLYPAGEFHCLGRYIGVGIA
jgi:hypothetical protein